MTETTTRPVRTRAPRAAKTAPAKAASKPAVAAKVETPTETTKGDAERFTFAMTDVGPTKTYQKYTAPAELAGIVVGQLYVPPGVVEVRVLLIGPADVLPPK